jgi:hypothetical protein
MSGDLTPITNNAIVNMFMYCPESRDSGSQICNADHLLLWHTTTKNIPLLFRLETGFDGWNKNCSIQENVFTQLSGVIASSTVIDRNHYAQLSWDQSVPPGTNGTTGDPKFVNESNPPTGYHLQNSSPAYHAGLPMECVSAGVDGNPFDASHPSLGVYEQS